MQKAKLFRLGKIVKKNALCLYKMKLYSVIRKYKYNYISETVALFCVAIIFLLFIYMLNDFLNEQLRYISQAMTNRISVAFSIIVLFFTSIYVGRSFSQEQLGKNSCLSLSIFLGDIRKTRILYLAFYAVTLVIVAYIPAWCLVLYYFISWKALSVMCATLLMLTISTLTAFLSNNKILPKKSIAIKRGLLTQKKHTPVEAMFLWRIKQILLRNKQSQLCLFVSILFVLLVFYLGYTNKPFLFVLSASLSGGLFIGFAFSLQIAADFQTVWLEKNSGVSHDNYLKVLRQIGFCLGSAIGILMSITWFFSQTEFDYEWQSWIVVFKFGIISFISSWLLPYLVFQVDVHRPFVHLLTLTIVSLFLGTAVFANILSVFVFPLVRYYGLISQEKRFYRA